MHMIHACACIMYICHMHYCLLIHCSSQMHMVCVCVCMYVPSTVSSFNTYMHAYMYMYDVHVLFSCPVVQCHHSPPPLQGNFFQNLGSIIVFAVFGTAISTFLVGGGLVALAKLGVIYELSLVQW